MDRIIEKLTDLSEEECLMIAKVFQPDVEFIMFPTDITPLHWSGWDMVSKETDRKYQHIVQIDFSETQIPLSKRFCYFDVNFLAYYPTEIELDQILNILNLN
jgi:hypothetical protein